MSGLDTSKIGEIHEGGEYLTEAQKAFVKTMCVAMRVGYDKALEEIQGLIESGGSIEDVTAAIKDKMNTLQPLSGVEFSRIHDLIFQQ